MSLNMVKRACATMGILSLVLVIGGCGTEIPSGGKTYTFKGVAAELTQYDSVLAALPQYTFTDEDGTAWMYFLGSFKTGDVWKIMFGSPSGERDRESDPVTVVDGATHYFVSAGDGIELYNENGEWTITLVINDEEIGSGNITIDRESLGD